MRSRRYTAFEAFTIMFLIPIIIGLLVSMCFAFAVLAQGVAPAPIACPPASPNRVCDLFFRVDSPGADAILVRRIDTQATLLRVDKPATGWPAEVKVSPPAPTPGTDHVRAEFVACDFYIPTVEFRCSSPAPETTFLIDLSAPAFLRALANALGQGGQ